MATVRKHDPEEVSEADVAYLNVEDVLFDVMTRAAENAKKVLDSLTEESSDEVVFNARYRADELMYLTSRAAANYRYHAGVDNLGIAANSRANRYSAEITCEVIKDEA